jgi:hypothetical protein
MVLIQEQDRRLTVFGSLLSGYGSLFVPEFEGNLYSWPKKGVRYCNKDENDSNQTSHWILLYRSPIMKIIMKLLAVFALTLAAFARPSTVNAGGGGTFNFKGPSVRASFYDGLGCVITDVFVIATEARFRDDPGPAQPLSFASVTIFQYNSCTDTVLLNAYGSTSPLSPGDFQMANQLSSAALNTTVNLFDEVSGNTFDVSVDLTWTTSGPPIRSHNVTHSKDPGCKINSHVTGYSNPAEAWGTISDGTTNFTPYVSSWANLDLVRSGTVTIGCTA